MTNPTSQAAATQDATQATKPAPRVASVSPFDRLPVTALFNAPPPNSPYHTARARDARENALTYLPEGAFREAAQTLFDAGLRRRHVDIPDMADHNALTLAAARTYAAHGFHVADAHGIYGTGKQTLSGNPDGCKVPRGAKWQDRATTDDSEIVNFWIGNGEYPENDKGEIWPYARVNAPRNVSIVYPAGCSLFALDIDGDRGQAALAKLEVEHGRLPETVTLLSGSQKGFQMIFRTSEAILNTASAIAPGVDIRGEGGQSVAPPSVHPSFGYYEWEEGHAPGEVDIANAPEWLVKAALEASKKTQAERGRRLRPEGHVSGKVYEPKEPTGDSAGFESILETIGDDAEGFDKPIYRAACSWFGAHGWDADKSTLFDQLQEAILAAPCDNNRNEDRYATPGYLEPRIEQARDFIRTAEAEETAFCAAGVEDEGEEPGEEVTDTPGQQDSGAPEDRAAVFDRMSKGADIEEFLKRLFAEGIDVAERNRVTEILADNTALGKRDVNKMWLKLDKVQRKIEADRSKAKADDSGVIVVPGDFDVMCDRAQEQFEAANAAAPFLFDRLDDYAVIHHRGGVTTVKLLTTQGAYEHHLNNHVRFAERKGDDGLQGAPAPAPVAKHLYHADKAWLPALDGVTSTPFFSRSGVLVAARGYHEESKMCLEPGSFVVDPISDVPTMQEAVEALKFLVEELADFPIGGLKRPQIEKQFWDDSGIPSMVHTLCDLFLPFMRPMIAGPTPGHVFNKPAPGTGASLLCDLTSIISTGAITTPITPPKERGEFEKTLGAAMHLGRPKVYFDNVNDKLDSGLLASAMTTETFGARILGKTELMDVNVKCVWEFTANKLAMTWELLRRCILIHMDTGLEDPSQRNVNEMRRPDIKNYVRENRAQFVHACLTVIQYWVAAGMPEQRKANLDSYEEWSRKMGGLFECLGIAGFLGNEEQKRGDLATGERDVIREFVGAMVQDALDNKTARTDGRYAVYAKSNPNKTDKTFVSITDVLESFVDEPIRFNGWNWVADDVGVKYPDTRLVREKFKELVWKSTFTVEVEEGEADKDGHRETVRKKVFFEYTKDRNKTRVFYMSVEAF